MQRVQESPTTGIPPSRPRRPLKPLPASLPKVREERREPKETHRLVAESAGEAIVLCDRHCRISYLNPASERITGYRKEELLGRSLKGLIPGEAFERVICTMDSEGVNPSETSGLYETCLFKREGGRVPVEICAVPVRDESLGILLTARDISFRKNLEEEALLAKKLESVGILAGGIAHDYNNLLTALIGYLSLARSLLPSEDEAWSMLGRAQHTAALAKDLSNKLITFAKGGIPLRRHGSVLPMLEHTLGHALSGSDINCEFRAPVELWPVEFDEAQLTQAIHNVLINAKEAMGGEGEIRVTARNLRVGKGSDSCVEPGNWVLIVIEDQGAGIDPADMDKIFDPYFSTKEMGPRKGLGLGLAIAYSIVKRHQGHILIRSRKGQGTSVRIYLPAAEAAGKARPAPRAGGQPPLRDDSGEGR